MKLRLRFRQGEESFALIAWPVNAATIIEALRQQGWKLEEIQIDGGT